MRSVSILCILLASTLGPAAAANMTHEETVVRTAYAKFSYASEEGVIGALAVEALTPERPVDKRYAAMTADQRFAAARVSFTLSEFIVGDIDEILDRKALELISTSAGQPVLEGSIGINNYSEPGISAHWNHLDASWQLPHPFPPSELQALQSLKLADLYQLQWQKPRPESAWQRYASYSVTVTFQGKVVGPYKALFIFGHDDKGNATVEVQDAIVPGLFSAMYEHLFPDALVLTHMRKYPVVTNWLKAKRVSGASCSSGQGDVCCDLVKLTCGLGSQDLAEGLSRLWPDPSSPIPPAPDLPAPTPANQFAAK
jgi:hypothetical protein